MKFYIKQIVSELKLLGCIIFILGFLASLGLFVLGVNSYDYIYILCGLVIVNLLWFLISAALFSTRIKNLQEVDFLNQEIIKTQNQLLDILEVKLEFKRKALCEKK